jgi:predicted methyltransferase
MMLIDDGSHYSHHQKLCWETLFPQMLKPGGVYIIEDYQMGGRD